jgi:hypothetical protein
MNNKKKASNNLWLVKPAYEKNKKYISHKNGGEYKKLVKPKVIVECIKIVASGGGKPPCARYKHSATSIRSYLVIYGGRNDEIYSGNQPNQPQIKNVALNDLHLYDTKLNMWMQVALYGELPCSRWGHSMAGSSEGGKDKILVFGGINLESFCDSSIYEFSFSKYLYNGKSYIFCR